MISNRHDTAPLITVITVTYNASKVIGKTIHSLATQDFKDFEWLVIDGNSKDDTLDKVKASRIPGLNFISEPDGGLYDAMNKGLKLAKGNYVLFLNAGDAFHSQEILKLYAEQALQARDIIYADTDIVDSQGNLLGKRHLSAPETLTKKSFADGMLVCHQAFMVRKELAPAYDLAYSFSADYDWCVKCVSRSNPQNCVNLHTVAIDYLSEGLTDKNKWKSLRERFRIMSRHYGFTKTLLRHFSFIVRALKRGSI